MNIKYEYLLQTWGGFYNSEYQEIHGEVPGFHYFDTESERAEYLEKLHNIEKELSAYGLMIILYEGYTTRNITKLHRVIRYGGKDYYSSHDLHPDSTYEDAKYHLEHKWYPGHNDYPLGHEFDYGTDAIEIIQEWITGAFNIMNERNLTPCKLFI